MKRLLLAGAAALALTTAAQAQQTVWQQDKRFNVWRNDEDVPGGGYACFLKAFQPTTAGYASWGIAALAGQVYLTYQETGLVWRSRGLVWLHVDNYPEITLDMQSRSDDLLDGRLTTTAKPFVAELATGSSLSIRTISGTRVFSLGGSAAAMANLNACVSTMTPAALPPSVAPLPPAIPAPAPAPQLPPAVGTSL